MGGGICGMKLQFIDEIFVFLVSQVVLDIEFLSGRICQSDLVISGHDLTDNEEHHNDSCITNTVNDHACLVGGGFVFEHDQGTNEVTECVKDHVDSIVENLLCVSSNI